jgi:hypothetical protein
MRCLAPAFSRWRPSRDGRRRQLRRPYSNSIPIYLSLRHTIRQDSRDFRAWNTASPPQPDKDRIEVRSGRNRKIKTSALGACPRMALGLFWYLNFKLLDDLTKGLVACLNGDLGCTHRGECPDPERPCSAAPCAGTFSFATRQQAAVSAS